jgi:hypothetical protein
LIVAFAKDIHLEIEKDIKEEGNSWTIAKQTPDLVVKQTTKKKGSEIPAYQCVGILPFSPEELLEKIVTNVEAVKVQRNFLRKTR